MATPAHYVLSWLGGPYNYEVLEYTFSGGQLTRSGSGSVSLTGLELELESTTYWELLAPAIYHDMFFHRWRYLPQRTDMPQITGSVGEIVAVLAMRQRYGAANVQPLHPTPRRRSADFAMELPNDGGWDATVVEVKSTNRNLVRPDLSRIAEGAVQVTITLTQARQRYVRGFVALVSHPGHRIFVAEVI